MFLAILHQRNTIALSTEVNLNSLVVQRYYLTWEVYYNCVNCRVFNVFFSLSHFLGLDCSQEQSLKSISIFLYVYSPILLGWVFINGHRYILSFLTCTTLTYFSASPNLLFLPFHLFTYAVVYLFYPTWQEAKVRSNLENIFSLDSLTPSHVFDWSTFCPNSFTSYLCFLNRHSFLPYFSTPQPSVPSPYHHRYVICLSFSTFHFSAAALTSSSLIPWTL